MVHVMRQLMTDDFNMYSSAFSMNIPNLPMQIVAITDPGGVSAFFSNELCQVLITEGNAVADKLRAHFVTAGDEDNQFKCKFFITIK